MDGIPFELLDPCCQKDVLERRRNQELKDKLSTTDPSLKKEKQIQSVFNGIFKTHTCHTCCAPRDYPLLAQSRAEIESAVNVIAAKEGDGADSGDSDSDLDLLGDEFESELEIEMKAKMMERTRLLQQKAQLGLGLHTEDSEEHILRLVEAGARIIVHVYDPSSTTCAQLDLSLETAAKRYSSTRFRRIPMFNSAGLCSAHALPPHLPMLACFMEKRLIISTTHLAELVPDGEVGSNNLFRFLDNSKVAVDQDSGDDAMSLSELLAARAIIQAKDDEDSEGEEAGNTYCDEPGCAKYYAHTHIGAAGQAGAANLFSGSASGSEALGKDYFGKI